MNSIYHIGIDPGEKGAIAFISPYLKESFVMPVPEYTPWHVPRERGKDIFYRVNGRGYKKGHRKYGTEKKEIAQYLNPFHAYDTIQNALATPECQSPLWDIHSTIEIPGGQGGGRAGFANSKTVGGGISSWAAVIERLTGLQPFKYFPCEWQDHSVIKTKGRHDWEHEAKDKGEAKKHFSILRANEIFSLDLDFSQDGEADALLIGLFGALRFPPVVKLSPLNAWFVLEHPQSRTMPFHGDLPWEEALICVDTMTKKEYLERARELMEAFPSTPIPPLDKLKKGGLVGWVKTKGEYVSTNKDWLLPEQTIVSRKVYPDVVDYSQRGLIHPYLHQLPHLI